MDTGMEPGVGLTAVAMAQDRHLESEREDRLIEDPLAGELVTAALESSDHAIFPWLQDGLGLADVYPDIGDYVAFRTRYFDDRIRDTVVGDGPRQVVLVAAGLDARAFRLPWPQHTRLYELDLPSITAFKQRVVDVSQHRPRAERHTLGVDLREDWPNALREKGFCPQEPTLWIAEGLLMYLTEQANDLLMGTIAELSAPGSHLIADHSYPAIRTNDGFRGGRDNLDANGSGILSHIADPHAWLGGHGWQTHLADLEELATTYRRPVPPIMDPQRPNAPIFWFAHAHRQP